MINSGREWDWMDKETKMRKRKIQPNWYKIKGIWYHCITTENGDRYVNGKNQTLTLH